MSAESVAARWPIRHDRLLTLDVSMKGVWLWSLMSRGIDAWRYANCREPMAFSLY